MKCREDTHTRTRAPHTLGPGHPSQDRSILRNLLGCLHYDNGLAMDGALLSLLAQLCCAPPVCKRLLSEGAQRVGARVCAWSCVYARTHAQR
jgi:hypothetical protein